MSTEAYAPLIEIAGVKYFDAYTWADHSTKTFADVAAEGKNTWLKLAIGPKTKTRHGSAGIDHRIEERSTARFAIDDLAGSYVFEKGQHVRIWGSGDGVLLFGGVIDRATKRWEGNTYVSHEIECADYHYLADKRLFSGAYEAATAAEVIVQDILEILREEGVTEGLIMAGEVLERQAFPHQPCSEAMDKLAELSGYTWFISEERKLYFISRSAYPAAWNIADGSDLQEGSIVLSEGNPEYRNVQLMMGGSAETDEITERFKGDGSQKTFVVGYPLAYEPIITVDGIPQDVGIKGVESGKAWYWNKGDPSITQEYSDNPVASGSIVEIKYVGRYPLIAKVSQVSEITARRLIEGFGTGKVERAQSDPTLLDQAAAQQAARGKLLHYATIGRSIEYTTSRHGLAAGVLQTVSLDFFNLTNAGFLITGVGIEFGDSLAPDYRVEAVEGPVDPSWEQIFCDLAQLKRKEDAAGEAATVQGLEEFSKTWYQTDHPNPFIKAVPGDSTLPGNLDLPSFEDGDELKFLVLYSGGIEFFRKQITYQERSASEILSICIVMAQEANGIQISHAGLWGGDTCSDVAGSGVEMSKFAYSKLKNSLETMQLDFHDLRGW